MEPKTLNDLLESLSPEYREPFLRLVDEGELSPDFADVLERDPALRRAVDTVCHWQARAFEAVDQKRRREASGKHVDLHWYLSFALLGGGTAAGFALSPLAGAASLCVSVALLCAFVLRR